MDKVYWRTVIELWVSVVFACELWFCGRQRKSKKNKAYTFPLQRIVRMWSFLPKYLCMIWLLSGYCGCHKWHLEKQDFSVFCILHSVSDTGVYLYVKYRSLSQVNLSQVFEIDLPEIQVFQIQSLLWYRLFMWFTLMLISLVLHFFLLFSLLD